MYLGYSGVLTISAHGVMVVPEVMLASDWLLFESQVLYIRGRVRVKYYMNCLVWTLGTLNIC